MGHARRGRSGCGVPLGRRSLALARREHASLWTNFVDIELVLVESLQAPLVPVTEELVHVFPAFARETEESDKGSPWLTALDVATGTM